MKRWLHYLNSWCHVSMPILFPRLSWQEIIYTVWMAYIHVHVLGNLIFQETVAWYISGMILQLSVLMSLSNKFVLYFFHVFPFFFKFQKDNEGSWSHDIKIEKQLGVARSLPANWDRVRTCSLKNKINNKKCCNTKYPAPYTDSPKSKWITHLINRTCVHC